MAETQSTTEARSPHQIYTLPAPIRTFPLPTFYPNNPISLVHVVSAWLAQWWAPPPAEPSVTHRGAWSAATSSVHVTDDASVRALWEQGFYGKGSLSRSEPNWLKREQVRLGLAGEHVSEILTQQRREERLRAKWERARLEQEAIRQTRLAEAGPTRSPLHPQVLAPVTPAALLALPNSAEAADSFVAKERPGLRTIIEAAQQAEPREPAVGTPRKSVRFSPKVESTTFELGDPPSPGHVDKTPASPPALVNKEHLQLMPEEAFFLSFGLGALTVTDGEPLSTEQLLALFRQHSSVPAQPLQPDDKFLVHYAVYHHFRSLGWVPRAGIKFGVDWLLYTRGPVFDHAEFGLAVIPSYADAQWSGKTTPHKTWQWLHASVRVLSHVMKSLVLVYVDVPPPSEFDAAMERGLAEVFRLYKVREVMVKRWSANRNR